MLGQCKCIFKNKTRSIEPTKKKKNREPIKKQQKKAQDNLGCFENA